LCIHIFYWPTMGTSASARKTDKEDLQNRLTRQELGSEVQQACAAASLRQQACAAATKSSDELAQLRREHSQKNLQFGARANKEFEAYKPQVNKLESDIVAAHAVLEAKTHQHFLEMASPRALEAVFAKIPPERLTILGEVILAKLLASKLETPTQVFENISKMTLSQSAINAINLDAISLEEQMTVIVDNALTGEFLAKVEVHPEAIGNTLRVAAEKVMGKSLKITASGAMLDEKVTLPVSGVSHNDHVFAVVRQAPLTRLTYYADDQAWAELMEDGSVVTEGAIRSTDAQRLLTGGVQKICATDCSFAALRNDGSAYAWGSEHYGAREQLESGVHSLCSIGGFFAALMEDGSVVTWGGFLDPDTCAVLEQLKSGVRFLCSTGGGSDRRDAGAFAAVKVDGSVVTWGNCHDFMAARCHALAMV